MKSKYALPWDDESRICQCEDCGRRFHKGAEGDNERFCLRCDHNSRIESMDQEERDYYYVYGDGE